MNEITCTHSCYLKLDLQNSKDKLPFLKDNWPSFIEIDEMINLSREELMCSICLLDVILESIAKKEYIYPKEKTVDLIKARLYLIVLL